MEYLMRDVKCDCHTIPVCVQFPIGPCPVCGKDFEPVEGSELWTFKAD